MQVCNNLVWKESKGDNLRQVAQALAQLPTSANCSGEDPTVSRPLVWCLTAFMGNVPPP